MKSRRIIVLWGLFCVLASVLIIPSTLVAKNGKLPDAGLPGPYAVGHTSFVLTDPSRQAVDTFFGSPLTIPRPIPVHIFYPVDPASINASTQEAVYPLDLIHLNFGPFLTYSSEWEQQGIDPAYQEPVPSANGPFPVVVFSQGWGGPAWMALYVGTRLASHGFVVALLYHYGDAFWFYEPFDDLATASMNRPIDVSFTLTKLLERNSTAGDALYKLMDLQKVAASGWSLGGYAAMALAAGDDLICDKPIEVGWPDVPQNTCVATLVDPRIRAIVPLDGSTQLLYFDELARITVPTMGIGEEWSMLASTMPPPWESWQARLHAASQGHPAYRVDVQGANHGTFSNTCEFWPIAFTHGFIDEATYEIMSNACSNAPILSNEAHRIVTKYMVAFLKTNLSHESGYQPVLTPGHALNSESMVEFFVTEKRNPNAVDEDWPGDYMYFMHQPGSEQAKAMKDPAQALPVPYVGLAMGQK